MPTMIMFSRSTKFSFSHIFETRSPRPLSGLDSVTLVLDSVTPHCRIAIARKSNTRNSTA